MFTLKFSTANAAFDGTSADYVRAVAAILREVAHQIENGHRKRNVLDSNGNTIGQYELRG